MIERYIIVNVSDNYNDLGFKFKTLQEAKKGLKELKKFDKRNGNPFNDEYIIIKEEIDYEWR